MKTQCNLDSKVKELYATPVGHDTLSKILLQLGMGDGVLQKGPIANLKLKRLRPFVNKDFLNAIIHLVNQETDEVVVSHDGINPTWWKEAVFYQVYPRSFYDTDGDGIGDLKGIISKLDYLKELGINAIWLSPIYDSPNDDNGYDIRDYYKIMNEFGTMEDFDALLKQVHARDMRLIMDLVVNHTSDEHIWFQEALRDKNSKYRKYYYIYEDVNGTTPPNNWTSFFSGSAWKYYQEYKCWALHLFSEKQMDLNWENEDVRNDIIEMIRWWLDKGVDGFRMDVINYISKESGLPNGDETVGKLMGFTGVEKYYYGPRLHEFLKEMKEKAFAPYQAMSVGETPGLGMKMAQLVTSENRKELDMIFSFDHLESPGKARYDIYNYDLNYLRDYLIDWQLHYGDQSWMSFFLNNHDNPRMISKIEKDESYHATLAKLLAAIQFTSKATPFVFQGDEMGLANYHFTSMDQITDVEAKGYYREHIQKEDAQDVFEHVLAGTREHCRVLLPWNQTQASYHAGLTQDIKLDVYEDYKTLIQIRKNNKVLIYGEFNVILRDKNRFVYQRFDGSDICIVDCNLSKESCEAYVPEGNSRVIYDNVKSNLDISILEGYQVRIWKKMK